MHMHSPSCRPGVSHPNRIATHKQCMSGCLFVCSILGGSTLHWKHNTQLGWNSWHNYMNLHLSMQQFNDFSCKLFRTLICLLHAGVLCGQCRGDKGVSALLNKCVSCHDASGLLIAGLISSSCETGKFDTPSSLICIGSGTLYILPLCISLIVNQNTSWIHVSVYELMCANIFTWYSTWLVILGRYLSGNMTTGRFMWRSKMVDLFTCQMSDKIKRDQASIKLYNCCMLPPHGQSFTNLYNQVLLYS